MRGMLDGIVVCTDVVVEAEVDVGAGWNVNVEGMTRAVEVSVPVGTIDTGGVLVGVVTGGTIEDGEVYAGAVGCSLDVDDGEVVSLAVVEGVGSGIVELVSVAVEDSTVEVGMEVGETFDDVGVELSVVRLVYDLEGVTEADVSLDTEPDGVPEYEIPDGVEVVLDSVALALTGTLLCSVLLSVLLGVVLSVLLGVLLSVVETGTVPVDGPK